MANGEINAAILAAFGMTADRCSLTQARHDLRKLKAYGLLERTGRNYAYRLTDKGIRTGAMFILFHKRVCGPLANSSFITGLRIALYDRRRSSERITTRIRPCKS